MLTPDFVSKIVKGGLNPLIKKARDKHDTLRLHVDGDRDLLTTALEKINHYENDDQYKAREKHAISNSFLVDELLNPTNNAFNAKGGSKNYIFSTDREQKEIKFKEILSNVKGGMSLSEYIEKIWFHKLITDPNGLILLEQSESVFGENEEEDYTIIEPCYKSTYCIRDYKQNGIFVDWVIFEPHIEYKDDVSNNKNVKIFVAIDEINFYKYKIADEIILIESIPHSFGKVPAVLCSDITDNVEGLKISPIDKQVELLNKYLVSNSVLSIAEFSHNYPREWTYVEECPSCFGSGEDNEGNVCPKCNGTRKASRDVTEINEIKIPDAEGVKIDPPSGYVYLPVDSWKVMVDSVDRYNDKIFFSHWGTTISKDAKNETATGRFIDAQPVNNKLEKYSQTIEKIHATLADLFGKYYFPETFIKSEIKYGDRYLIETPDQIWEKYLKSKERKAPVSELNLLLYQFIESEFKNKPYILDYEMKKVKLEPFVHWDIQTVRVSTFISDIDKVKKEYFNEWILRKDKKYIIETDIDKLDEEFTLYVQQKNIKQNEQQKEV